MSTTTGSALFSTLNKRKYWSLEEDALLKSNLSDGITLDKLHSLLSPRTNKAILTRALNKYGYRSETTEDITKLYKGVVPKNRRTKAEIEAERVVTDTIEPTLCNSIDTENKLDDVVIKIEPISQSEFLHIQNQINLLLQQHSLLREQIASLHRHLDKVLL